MLMRDDQIRKFDQEREQQFLRRLMTHILQTQPSAGPPVSGDTLERMVTNGIARARKNGLTQEASIAAFVALMFEIGPNFDEHPAFRQVLDDRSLPEVQRIESIPNRVRQEEFEAAATRYDMAAWFRQ